jgi:pentatricopeptide repeat protein
MNNWNYLTKLLPSLENSESYILFFLFFIVTFIYLKLIFWKSTSIAGYQSPALTRKSRGLNSHSEVIVDLEKLKFQMLSAKSAPLETPKHDQSPHHFNVKIKEEYGKKEYLDPFSVIEEMKSLGLKPDITTFNTLLDICFEQMNQDLAFNFFSYIKSLGSKVLHSETCEGVEVHVDVVSYNTLLKGLCLQMMGKKPQEENHAVLLKCIELLEEIKSNNIHANEITYNTLIDACVKADEMDLAFKFFAEMKKRKLQPDNFTYATMIKGIKNHHASLQKEVRDYNRKMKEKEDKMTISDDYNLDTIFEILTSCQNGKPNKPDEILFNCVIDACVKFDDISKALETYNEMLKLGIKPSSITYTTLIRGFGNLKNFEGVMSIYEKVVGSKLKMNEVMFSCLIDACVKCEKVEEAMNFFQMMLKNPEMKVNGPLYSLLIKAFTNCRKFDKAYEVFGLMNSNPQITPSIIGFNAMLESAIRCNNVKFFEIYEEITKRINGNFKPDLITYSTYIKGLCKFNRVSKAFDVYNQLKKDHVFNLDEVLYNSLLHGLQKAKEYDRVLIVYRDMVQNNIRPSSVTYSILIKVYADQYEIEEALETFEKAKQSLRPGLVLYTCIIQACIRCKKVKKVMQLHHEMNQKGIECDEVLYNIIISGLTFNFHLREATDLLFEAFDKELTLNHDVYLNVLKNLRKKMNNKKYSKEADLPKEQYERTISDILRKMKDLGIEINRENWNHHEENSHGEMNGRQRDFDKNIKSTNKNRNEKRQRRTANKKDETTW